MTGPQHDRPSLTGFGKAVWNLLSGRIGGAHKAKKSVLDNDWNYRGIAIHHAGRSFACGPASLQLQGIQHKHMYPDLRHQLSGKGPRDDIGYHYAVDCFGNIYEGRDIRFKGAHLKEYNTGMIGIVLLENLTDAGEGDDKVSTVLKFFDSIGFNKNPQVPSVQAVSLRNFVSILCELFNIEVLGGHREFPKQQDGDGRICPGNGGMTLVKALRSSLGLGIPR